MPSPLQLRRGIFATLTQGNITQFAGLLDDLTDFLEGAWSIAKTIQKSYTGYLITARRGADGEEMDIGTDSAGSLDLDTLSHFVGTSDWYLRRIYDQSGHGRHLVQNTSAAQPQGSIDSHGLAHAVNPHENIGTVEMTTSALSLPIHQTTQWAVGSAASYAVDLMTIRGDYSRRLTNFSNAVILDIPGGFGPFISGTNNGLYSLVGQFGSTSRLHAGSSTAFSALGAPHDTATFFSAGNYGGGPNWSHSSRWYAGAVWSANLGDACIDLFQSKTQTLFSIL